MKVYVSVSEALMNAVPDLHESDHEMYDKQFDNVWVKPGMRVFENVVRHLEEDQIAEHIRIVTEEGEELTPDDVADTLEQNNVIYQ